MKKRFQKHFLFVIILFAASTAHADGDWAQKSVHESGENNTYKHPDQGSFTGPFDYAPEMAVEQAPAAPRGQCNQFTFDATKSHDVDGQKLSVMWDFGDGTTSDQPVVSKLYDRPGDYDVKLTVKDSSGMVCDTNAAATRVTANFPPTCNAGEERSACEGEAVAFSAGDTASSGSAYRWDFGDGTSGEGAQTTHAYDKAGNYRVTVSIDDGKGTRCSTAACGTKVSVAERVTVALEGEESACTGRNVSFNAIGTGASNFRWDFGDGTTWEGGSRASHTYEKGGNYTVTVTADNGRGFSCSMATASHSVKINSTPIASAGENVACCVGETTSFDASGSNDPDGDALNYHWDFGDGQTSDQKTTTHVYEKSGNYRVVLTVRDDTGAECGGSSDSFVAVVNTKPQAVIEVR